MPTFKTLSNEEFLLIDTGREGAIHLEKGATALIYVPEPSNFWGQHSNSYTYFVCLDELKAVPSYKTASGRDSRHKTNKYPVLGIAELQVSPFNENEIWLKYVSVHGKHHGKGIGRELGRMIAEHMQGTGKHLVRSSASDLSMSGGFQAYMDKVLDEHGISWTQSGRDNGLSFG